LALEISVVANVRHGRKQFSQVASRWTRQRRSQDGAQLSLLAAAMGPGAPLELMHKGVIDATHQQISHATRDY
jgi:hypothetical protein